MSAVTVKKAYGCGDKGPPEPLSPAACSCSSVLPGCCGEDVYCLLNITSSSSVAPPQHWEGLAFCLLQNQPFSPVCPGAYSFCLWCNSPSRQQHRTVHSQWQRDKTCTSCHCRHWRTWAISSSWDGSGPSCTLLLCWQTTPVCYPQVFADQIIDVYSLSIAIISVPAEHYAHWFKNPHLSILMWQLIICWFKSKNNENTEAVNNVSLNCSLRDSVNTLGWSHSGESEKHLGYIISLKYQNECGITCFIKIYLFTNLEILVWISKKPQDNLYAAVMEMLIWTAC